MKVGVALSSGGARGFAHLGVLEVLEREGIPINIMTGSSVGAVIASMYAFRPKVQPSITQCRNYLNSDLYDTTKLTYFKINEEGVKSLYDKVKIKLGQGAVFTSSLSRTSLFNGDTLKKNVQYLVPAVNIEESIIQLGIVAFDLVSGDELLLEQGPLVPSVMASCAIPGIFPPIDGKLLALSENYLLMDGGTVNPLPCDHLRNMGADIVIAVDLHPHPDHFIPLNNTYEVAMRSADISRIKLKDKLASLADIIIPVDMGDIFWADFTQFDECVERGRQGAEKALPKIHKVLKL